MHESTQLSQKLIQHASISGEVDPGALDEIQNFLEPVGFECERLIFEDPNSYAVDNLFAKFGNGSQHFCFAGHTDVVSPGEGWNFDPFGGIIETDSYTVAAR